MRIILNETETGAQLQLEVYKVDTPTGAGWSVLTPHGRKVLLKLIEGNWHAEDDHSLSQEFWQMVGEEISGVLEAGQLQAKAVAALPIPKIERVKRYILL